MKKYVTGLINNNWFFVSLLIFSAVLPLSEGLVSIAAAIVLIVSALEDTWKNKWDRITKRKVILLIPLIFLLYLISTLLTLKQDKSFYDLQKTLFYLVFPLAFSLGKEINARQKRFVFYVFGVSVFVAIVTAMWQWKFGKTEEGAFTVHNISLISHIRFSFQLILILWFFIFLLQKNSKQIPTLVKASLLLLIFTYLGYLLFQQSLTGVIALGGSLIVFLVYLVTRVKAEWQVPMVVVLLLILFVPIIYVKKVVNNFYNIEKISPEELDRTTQKGNLYWHDFDSPLVENGHYVYLFVSEDEMREAWNKLSEFKYDSTGVNGYPVSSTLIRYLTSKGLRKDAVGVASLTTADRANIENGIANVVYTRKFSLYPRIYQTLWEYYVYTETGNSNNQSFSQRIEYARAAITIIKKNWLAGVGTGNWKTAFADAFRENNAQLDQDRYASSHNQYLNYMVKFGIPGFILIMFLLIFPIIKTRRYKDPFFLLFLVFMLLANFADSNLESHMGSSFFFFFYCLFVTTDGTHYLEIDKSRKE